jgi:hypothetical protein
MRKTPSRIGGTGTPATSSFVCSPV